MQAVLIVDNSRTVRKILQERIVYELRLEAQVASTLAETRDCIERNPFAFFIAVLGLTLADAPNGEIVDYVVARNIPVLVLTASSLDEVKSQIRSSPKILSVILKNDRYCFDQVLQVIQEVQHHQQIKILVAMTANAYRGTLIRLLEARRYVVLEAENAEHALEILRYDPEVKVLITDDLMLNSGNVPFIQKVRTTYSHNQLVIIGLCAADDHDAVTKLFRAGADDFLAIPFTDEECYQRLAKGLELIKSN